jgi:hypothetical protein
MILSGYSPRENRSLLAIPLGIADNEMIVAKQPAQLYLPHRFPALHA